MSRRRVLASLMDGPCSMKDLLIQLSPTSRDSILATLTGLKDEGIVYMIANLKGRPVIWMYTPSTQAKQSAEDYCIRLRTLETLKSQGRLDIGEILCRIQCGDQARYRIRLVMEELVKSAIVQQVEGNAYSLS